MIINFKKLILILIFAAISIYFSNYYNDFFNTKGQVIVEQVKPVLEDVDASQQEISEIQNSLDLMWKEGIAKADIWNSFFLLLLLVLAPFLLLEKRDKKKK